MKNYMLKFIKIKNRYGIRRIGELSINEQALVEYEKFCLDLIKENEKQKEVIDKANKKLNNFIGCCKAEKLESGNDYIHRKYWDMFERFNKQIKDILKEVEK